MPELFDLGFIRRYWMLIVMAVAFGGAGLSEMFHRLRQPVLSEPLANTALVAPFCRPWAFGSCPPFARHVVPDGPFLRHDGDY